MTKEIHPFVQEFVRRVRRRRLIMDLTQEEVAAAIRMTRGQYAGLERGRNARMQFVQMKALADILGTSTDYLLQRTEEDPGVIPPALCPGAMIVLAG
jgi:transcriptional regulator with XRE-family HTH domain